MKLRFLIFIITFFILLISSLQSIAAPSAPTLTHSISGLKVTVSWTSAPGATEYKLSYAPSPYTGPESIGSLNVGKLTSFTADLWEGAAFYVAVQAGDGLAFSEYSNIDNFSIASTAADLNGNWQITETWGPNNCGYPVGTQFNHIIMITQSGSSITVDTDSYYGYGLDELSGNLAGNTVLLTGSQEDEDFSETATINLTILPGNTLSGSVSWKSRDKSEGSKECLMNNSFTGIKTNLIPD